MAVVSRRTRLSLAAVLSFAAMTNLGAMSRAMAATPATQGAASSSAFTAEDLVQLARLSDPRVSPDGRHVIFTLRETDMAANRGRTDLWLVDTAATAPVARRLTQHPAADSLPRWAPDSSGVYFLSSRGGSSQVWFLSLAGGEAQPVTELPLDVGSFES